MGLIEIALLLIRDKLEEFFQNYERKKDGWISLSNIVEPDGTPYLDAEGKVVMFLANIQNDTTISTFNSTKPIKDNRYAVITPPHYIILYVLFYANFFGQRYRDGLGAISRTISFFQQNPCFTHENLPGLPSQIDKLAFELVNLDPTDLNYMMGLAGVKYLPSVYYKVRMIPFQGDAMQAEIPAARGVESPGTPKAPLADADDIEEAA